MDISVYGKPLEFEGNARCEVANIDPEAIKLNGKVKAPGTRWHRRFVVGVECDAVHEYSRARRANVEFDVPKGALVIAVANAEQFAVVTKPAPEWATTKWGVTRVPMILMGVQ